VDGLRTTHRDVEWQKAEDQQEETASQQEIK